MKLTTEVQRAADAERRPVASPIQAPGADVEGPRPSGPGRTICEACGQPVGPGICALPGCDRTLDGRRPDARYCSRACNQAARRARKGTRKVHARRRSGRQVSYAKGVATMAETMRRALNLAPETARAIAVEGLRAALPERQRARGME